MQLRPLSIIVLGLLMVQGAHAAGNPAAGKEKSGACVACHAVDGNSTNPQFPRLAGQHPDYLAKALMDYKSGERKNPIMAPFAASLSPQDMPHALTPTRFRVRLDRPTPQTLGQSGQLAPKGVTWWSFP